MSKIIKIEPKPPISCPMVAQPYQNFRLFGVCKSKIKNKPIVRRYKFIYNILLVEYLADILNLT